MPISERIMKLEEDVHDEESFITFVVALAEDWDEEGRREASNPSPPFGPGANGWENGTIGAFLGAASAWAESTRRGTDGYRPPANVWRRCAQILHAGKFYE